jgi:hypothetical protein
MSLDMTEEKEPPAGQTDDATDPTARARLMAILNEVDQLIVGGNGEDIRRAALMIYFDRYGTPNLR